MIVSFHTFKHVRHNLKFFYNVKNNRQISFGKPLKCNKNNIKEPINEGNYGDEKDKSKVSEKETESYPEEPTTCCMSGCANCVWLDYAEKLSEYYKDGGEQAIKEINKKVTDQNVKAFLLHELRMRNGMK